MKFAVCSVHSVVCGLYYAMCIRLLAACTMYSVSCCVQFTLYNVVCSDQYTYHRRKCQYVIFSVYLEMCSYCAVHYPTACAGAVWPINPNSLGTTAYTAHCTLYNVHCTVYSVRCTVHTLQCTQSRQLFLKLATL